MQNRDVFYQISASMADRQDSNIAANNWVTGVSSDYRSYIPSNAKYSSVATTRAGSVNLQKSFSNLSGTGRYSSYMHSVTNSSQTTTHTANRISYLAPSASRPNAYYWAQNYNYSDPIKGTFSNQASTGLNFYRLSDGNKVVMDQFKNTDRHLFWYNRTDMDTNLLTISNIGVVSKIETLTHYQDNPTNPTTPLLFQTHGGIPADGTTAWRTDYPREANWQSDNRETYIIYKPNFGSNTNISADIETMGEWQNNETGGRSGSRNANELAPQWIISDIIFLQQEDVYTAWNL